MGHPNTESELLEMRQKLAADPHRPSFHFLAPSNWINDPHGLIELDGRFHLFYQYNPHGPFHGSIHWGHAASEDLVHWHDLPIALAPGPEPYDQEGCWTGSLVIDNGVPTILYTAAHPQAVVGAVSHDELRTWQKLAVNPLIDGPPPELRPNAGGHFRDPFVWRSEHGWEMLIVSKIEGIGGQVLLYTSDDLRHWRYKGVFLAGNSQEHEPFWQGTMWECPNWLDFGDSQVLLISVQATPSQHLYTAYYAGRRNGDHLEPTASNLLVHGGSFYAPQVTRLSDGRFLMLGWLPEGRSQQASIEAGWNGSLSLPLVLELRDDHTLAINPAPELKALRAEHWHWEHYHLEGQSETVLPDVSGKSLEIVVNLTTSGDAEFGLKVLCSPDGKEETVIVYQHEKGQLAVERDHASLDQRADINAATMPVSLQDHESAELRVFVDRSIIEIFVDGRLCLACRVYPMREDSREVRLFSRRGRSTISDINIWRMKAIWPTTTAE